MDPKPLFVRRFPGRRRNGNRVPTTAAADDVRNLMISPAAGRDPQALYDTRPLAAAILSLLQSEPRLTALSPKFALLLDGGERLAMLDHPHDIWLAAMPARGDEPCVRVRTGRPSVDQATAAHSPPYDLSQVPALIRALLHTFLDLAAPDHTRMRHLLAASVHRHDPAARSDVRRFPAAARAASHAWRRARMPMPRCDSARIRSVTGISGT